MCMIYKLTKQKNNKTKQRITTKYSFPSERAYIKLLQQQQRRRQRSHKTATGEEEGQQQQQQQAPIAKLTVKTYHASSGICLKYSTDKVAEVGRLITILGRLAGSGAGGVSGNNADVGSAGGGGGDVDMTDAPSTTVQVPRQEEETAGKGKDGGGKGGAAGGGKSKKKGGKGKR